jgi:hypothetical protein
VYDSLDYEHSLEEIKRLANFDDIMNEAVTPFMELFYHFAVSQFVQNVFILKDASHFMGKDGKIKSPKIDREKAFIINDVVANKSVATALYAFICVFGCYWLYGANILFFFVMTK